MMEEQVRNDFERARQRAFVHDLLSVVNRRSNDLMPFHELRNRLSPEAESYRGMQTVPVNQIIGSMDRFRDFDRTFLPRRKNTRGRWTNIDRAYYEDVRLPPIQLYKVGDVYFVKDGNHRVSVARDRGVEFIDAEVIEGHVRVPLSSRMSPAELLMQAEYAEFLRRTDLDQLQPDHDIRPTALGRYDVIWEQIELHRRWLSSIWDREATVHEAVNDWYEYIYLPMTRIIRDRGVLEEFPRLTEADVYLWVMKHRGLLGEREGHDVGPVESAKDYAELMTQPLGVGDRMLELLGAEGQRSPDTQVEADRRSRRRLRRWHWPRRNR
ncbi:MAG: DUF4032 domain-containing protein [Chloroflexota bacterium]|nr:DUF4032 domain-containing protein [Chloroflexota bacterium]